MAFKYREEIVGKRFLSVSGPGKLKLFRILEWEWRSGIIRAVSHTDTKSPDLALLVEFDDINWSRREWVRVQDQGNFQVFLVENTLVWAQRKDPFQNKNNSVYWPALNFKPIVDKIGLREHRVKPVEFLVDKNLAFVEDSSLKVYQDLDESNQLASKEYLEVKKAVKSWIEYQDGQSILLTTPSVLVGYRVEVYRSEGTTQWYTAVIVSYNHVTRELTVTDDTVLEEHNEDPGLVQMKLIGDGVVDSILRGEKVGITPRRRTCTLQNPNNSIGHYSTRTRSQSPSHSTRSQVLTVSRKQRQQLQNVEIPLPLPEIEKSSEKPSSRLRSQRERKRKTRELEVAVIAEKKITNKRIKPIDISEIKEIEDKVQIKEIITIKEKVKNRKIKNLDSSSEKISTERRNEKRKTRIIDKAKKDIKKEESSPEIKEPSPPPPSPPSLKSTNIVSLERQNSIPCTESVEEKPIPEPVSPPKPEPNVECSESSTVIKCGHSSPSKNDLETAISLQQKRTTTNSPTTSTTTTTTAEAKRTKSKTLLIQSQNSEIIEQALSKPASQSIIKSVTDDRSSKSVTVAQHPKVNEEKKILKISNEEQSAFNSVEVKEVKTDSFRVTEVKRSKTSPSASPLVFDKNEPVKVWRDPNLVNADTAVRHITSLQHTTMHGHHAAATAAGTHSTVFTGVPSQPSHTAIGHPPMPSAHAVSQHSRSIMPPIHYGQHPGPGMSNPHMLPHLEQHAALARGLPYASVLPQATAHILSPYIHNDLLWTQKYGPMSLASSQWMIIQNQEGLVAREQERALLQEQERKDRERIEREQKEQHQRERELAERQRDHSDRNRQEREHTEREPTDRIERGRERESLHITSQHLEDPFRISGQKKNSPWNPIISNNPRIPQSRISSSIETGSPATTSHIDKPRDQSQSSGPIDRVKLEAVERKRVGTPAGDEHHLRRTQELLLVHQEEEKKLLALQQAEMIKQQRQHEKEEEALKLQQFQHEKDQRAVLKQAYSYKQTSESNNRASQDSARNYKMDYPQYSHIPQAASYSGPLYTGKASPLTIGMAAHRIKQEPNFNLYGYQPFQHSYIAQDKLPLSTQGKQPTVEQPKTSYPTNITQTVVSSGVKKSLPSPPQLVHSNENKQGHSVIVSTTSPGLSVATTKESEVQKPLSLTNNRDCKGTLPMSPKQQMKLYQQQDRNTPVSIGNPPPLNTASTTVASRNSYASFKPYDRSFAGTRTSPSLVNPQPLDLQRIPKPTAPTPPAPSPSPKTSALNSGTPSPSVIVSTTSTVHTTVADTPLIVSRSNTPHTLSSWTSSSPAIPSRNSTPHTSPAHTSPVWTSTTAQSTIPSWTSTSGLSYNVQQTHTSKAVYTEATASSKVLATCGSISSGLPINRPSTTTTTSTASTHTNTNIAQPAVLFASINSSPQPATTTSCNQPSHKRKPPKESSNRKRQKNDTIPQSSTALPPTISSPQFSNATTTVTSVTTTVTVPSASNTTLTSSNNIQLASANRSTGFIDSFKSFVQSSAQLSQQEHFYSKHAKGRHKTKALPSKQPPNQTLPNSASTSGSESTRVSNGMADSDSDTVGTASSPPLNRDTTSSPSKTNNPPKLKKAWLQRHSDEDKKEASKKQTEVSWQAKPEDLQQNQQQQLQSVTPSQPKERKPSHTYSTRLVNGHVGDTGKPPHLDDSTSSASETEAEMIKRKVKTKRRKTSSPASKRSKNNSESDGLLEEKQSIKEEIKQEIKVEPPNPEKPVPKKRGRKPKDPMSKTAPGRPLVKPSITKLKKSGEPFLQDGPCCEMTPKLSKCRECRLTPQQRNKKMPNIFCRFYAFRRLRYSRTGLLAKAGFSEPDHAEPDDLKPWLPQFNSRARELDVQTSVYILLNVADQFCELVRQECEAQSWAGSDAKVAWKRAVQGVREMCDVCETTLFNIHWVCHKCGFVVCLDCYRARSNSTIKDEVPMSKDRDNYSWLRCILKHPHELEKLMLTQMVPSSALWELGQMLSMVRKEWHIPSMGIYDNKLAKFSYANGVSQLLNAVGASSDICDKPIVNGTKDHRSRLNGSLCCHVKNDLSLGNFNSDTESPLNWLADLALNSSGKLDDFKSDDNRRSLEKVKEKLQKTSKISSQGYSEPSSDSESESEQKMGLFTLRQLLIRPNSKAARDRENRIKITNNPNNIDEIIASVLQRSGKRAERENSQRPRQLLHYIPKHSSPVTIPEPLPIRIHTLTETSLLYPEVPHSWLCDGRLLRLHDPSNKANFLLFQEQWKRGQPVLVSDVHKRLHSELWKPQAFSQEFGELKNDLVNCRTGVIIQNLPMKSFWDGFEDLTKRLRDENNEWMLLKLKDWPPGDDFSEMLPSRFQDLMQALPLPEYTQRDGKLNLASRLPDFFVRPDLGPKMYNAYGSAAFPSEGTTNLHLDISDAVNVMVHVGIPDGDDNGDLEEALKAIDDASCDIITKRRVREVHERPGALWHIYAARDADKIRDLLNKVAIERGEKLESHHDPIHDQSWYLDGELRERLYNEYGVVGYAIAQCLGDAVFIPAGAPHQVRNLHSCIKVAEDFVSPEHVAHCFKLTHEFRDLSDTHTNHEDKLQVKNIIYHAVKDAVAVLRFLNQSGSMLFEVPRQH